jgi:hypothetical protein
MGFLPFTLRVSRLPHSLSPFQPQEQALFATKRQETFTDSGAQAIGNMLLSGITTISPTIRYLSIRACIIRTFESSGLPATWKALEDFAASIESAIVLGNLLVNPRMQGLVGPDLAHPLVESGADLHLPVRETRPLRFSGHFLPPVGSALAVHRLQHERNAAPWQHDLVIPPVQSAAQRRARRSYRTLQG